MPAWGVMCEGEIALISKCKVEGDEREFKTVVVHFNHDEAIREIELTLPPGTKFADSFKSNAKVAFVVEVEDA